MPQIRVQSGYQQGRIFPLREEKLLIGRSPDTDINLDPESPASRHHAQLYPGEDGWRIQDLGSVNGTLLNGVEVQDTLLSPGDRIEIGDTVFVYESSSASAVAAAEQRTAAEPPPIDEDLPPDMPPPPVEDEVRGMPPPPPMEEAVPGMPPPPPDMPPPPPDMPPPPPSSAPSRAARAARVELPPHMNEAEVQEKVRQMSFRTKLIEQEIGKAIIGQTEIIRELLTAIVSNGHVLMIGMPGLAKTTLIRTLSEVLHLDFRRIQFTPDLMPSDITGTDILEVDENTGHKEYRFIRGPIFSQILLADEINRTPPKTQAALLEAMQEHRVTAAGQTFVLEEPFFVLATQNPLEQEGTYPLPEAQLDRFMFSIYIDYPGEEDEETIAKVTTRSEKPVLNKVLTGREILELQQVVRDMPISDHIVKYAIRLVRSTRPGDQRAPEFIKKWVHCGAGPRASQYLLIAAKARAVIEGRMLVTGDDVRHSARPILRHRMFTNFTADSEGVDTDKIVQKLVEEVEEPGEKDY